MEDRCPLCLKYKEYNLEENVYLRLQNTGRLVCEDCANQIRDGIRPTWQIIAGRIYPRSTKY